MEDTTESDPREVEAGKFNLNYVQVMVILTNKHCSLLPSATMVLKQDLYSP